MNAPSTLQERIQNAGLLAKVVPVEEAVKHVTDGNTVAISGFTKSGEPKTFFPALASHLAKTAPQTRITLLSGASLSEDVEGPMAPFIGKRGPYMSSSASRRRIHAGEMDFTDVHLSAFARNMMYGFYGDIDVAVVEVSRIRPNGSVILTSSVGVSAEALAKAKKIILEVNTSVPDYTGFHDIVLPTVHPHVGWPLPLLNVRDRIGNPYVEIDASKVVAVVESRTPDHPVPFKAANATDKRIAQNVVAFLMRCREQFQWGKRLPPIQSGVGNVANAIIGELYASPFQKIRFWTEVFQDGMLRYVEDDAKFEYASATAVSFSAEGRARFQQMFERCRERLVLRPMWLSNSPEIISRLFVIAMNTPIEVDIYGHVNSTHIDGSRIVNGLGGSGDFFRNAYLSIVHTPSVRKLKDGRTVSCVMPYVRHIDHTEHDIKCVVTEHGYALNMDIRSPKRRATDIIDQCAHPHFRPLLHAYLDMAGPGDEPRASDMKVLDAWWRDYDALCRDFPGESEAE
ncbi:MULTISPECIES: acetyl-CoA hydrolase/transferase C-terminal domain-containing protein [unclassified Myxococcus]|uniref:acetyl-CoA hydrolase/transferase C-terminal domain-containing protein n=1 Tax=unclassified Myxococcus TaxID=2648731 RepID=UPI00157AA56B|nr:MULTISPECIES: acetyl-CoA hydrolase/transferase C-terminal domain-containing protein [unclassified Myxococcus]NTX08710.1 acetyl-CoA hydrolase [Myxococcus sp. CA040A]NTX12876.1 acetyl-CoA hydrolase [Myxococcus sp. CA056]NTX39407.1 acetyl-CoA hydrolase [Myxococcus sp. CA033]